jgi:hypothetical protein
MRNHETIKRLHNWQPVSAIEHDMYACARCGLAQSRGNTWSQCSGIMGVLTNVQGTLFQDRGEVQRSLSGTKGPCQMPNSCVSPDCDCVTVVQDATNSRLAEHPDDLEWKP